MASVPNFCSLISQPVAATALDYLRSRKILTSTQIHKLFTCGSYVFAAILFVAVQSWTHFMATIIIFSTFRFVVGFSETSYNVLPVDVAPRYASLIAGIGSAFYSMGTLLSPILIGFIVTDHKHAQWNTYFSVLSVINVFGGVVFFLFGSGELQPWADPLKKENTTVKQEPSNPAVEEGRY
ncbi:hypothetical protein V9T40_001043 [Parthenolecanium corni]|uniref:Uncharacterized protein n=1 Tax=Parthenolecanium corni TaxID=536013 RepID=A0AAN9TC77_9HEMI